MIILGVDPGLTRCGVGVIEAGAYRRPRSASALSEALAEEDDLYRDLNNS